MTADVCGQAPIGVLDSDRTLNRTSTLGDVSSTQVTEGDPALGTSLPEQPEPDNPSSHVTDVEPAQAAEQDTEQDASPGEPGSPQNISN